MRSGRDYNKFAEMHLTPGKAAKVRSPIIEESPVNIECRITEIKPLGTHDMFLAEVVNVKADRVLINPRTGAFSLEKADPLAFAHGNYFVLGKRIGKFGFSVEKRRRRK